MHISQIKHQLWLQIKKIGASPIKKRAIYYETYKIILGVLKYNGLRSKVGADTYIFFFRGATGDLYLEFLLLNTYIVNNNIQNYVVVSDNTSITSLADIFYCSNVIIVPYTDYIEKAYLFLSKLDTKVLFPHCWTANFYGNRSRLRLISRFNFMDTYKYISFKFEKSPVSYRMPIFESVTEQVKFLWESRGIIRGKTIIIAPDANSITGLPIWFWNGIIKELQTLGYTVFMNCFYPTFFRAPNLFTSYKSAVPMLEYAGAFIGVRSGFCDIISSAKCKKIILYPKIQDNLNLDKHRSEVEYSGLAVMGLYQGEDLKEISTPLLRNITDKDYMLSGTDDYFNAIETLRKQIMENFKEVQNVSITNQSS